MTIYDVAMVAVVIAGMVWGVWRGITWQIASIASLVLGYSVSRTLSGQVASQFPGEPVVARGLAMLVIYAAVSGGVFLVAWIVRTTLRKLQFEAYDRHLGMVLGGLEGALLGMVATLFVVSLAPQSREPIFSSHAGRVVGTVMATLGPVLPDEARKVLAPFWDGTQHVASESEILATEPELKLEPEPEPKLGPKPELEPEPGRKSRWSAVSGEAGRIIDSAQSDGKREAGRIIDSARDSGKREASRIIDSARDSGKREAGRILDSARDNVKREAGRMIDSALGEGKRESTSLSDLIEESEARIGRAIVDRAGKELQKIGTGDANGRSVERR